MRSIGKALLWIAGIGVLLAIPFSGGRIFTIITDKFTTHELSPIELKDTKGAPASQDGPAQEAARRGAASFENAEAAKTHYTEGLKLFQETKYEAAKKEWEAAAMLDPDNNDVKTGLQRIASITEAAPDPKDEKQRASL